MSDSITIDISGFAPDQVARLFKAVQAIRNSNLSVDAEPEEPWRTAISTGWTASHVAVLRDKLAARGKTVQLAAFDTAIKNGGFISREDVFAIGDYTPDRKLNNWSTCFRNIATELVDEHGLPEGADLPMWADYNEGTGYRQTRGYLVAPEIIKLAREQVGPWSTE